MSFKKRTAWTNWQELKRRSRIRRGLLIDQARKVKYTFLPQHDVAHDEDFLALFQRAEVARSRVQAAQPTGDQAKRVRIVRHSNSVECSLLFVTVEYLQHHMTFRCGA